MVKKAIAITIMVALLGVLGHQIYSIQQALNGSSKNNNVGGEVGGNKII